MNKWLIGGIIAVIIIILVIVIYQANKEPKKKPIIGPDGKPVDQAFNILPGSETLVTEINNGTGARLANATMPNSVIVNGVKACKGCPPGYTNSGSGCRNNSTGVNQSYFYGTAYC